MLAGREGKKENQQVGLESHQRSHHNDSSPGSVQPDTGLVVANAIYFKGMWSMPFDREGTETRLFHLCREIVGSTTVCIDHVEQLI